MMRLAQTSIRIDPPTPTLKPIGFNPILSYVEGYAYDKTSAAIPNAKITVKLKADDQVFYQTTADDTGFFAIYSNNLPFFEYYLEITDPVVGIPVKQTTTEFVTLNQDYITSEDLDLIKSTQGGSSIVNPETGDINTIINSIPTPIVTTQPEAKATGQTLAIIVLLIFLIIALITGVFYILKKRK